jgi:hypothetical protein
MSVEKIKELVAKLVEARLEEWQRDAIKNVGDDLMRDIVRDNRRSVHERSSVIPETTKTEPVKKLSWVEPAPLGAYSGQRWIDAQIDVQDALDKAERAKRLKGEGEWR